MNKSTKIYRDDLLNWLIGRRWSVLNEFYPKAQAIISDPPYGLAFMNQKWDTAASPQDYQRWVTSWAEPLLDFVYPGAVLAMFGGSRTYHRLAAGLEDAGWQIIDCILYMYGSGFPKSRNLHGTFDGYGTALKPSYEPIVLARAPRNGLTFAECAQQYGSGALNIDDCRIGISPEDFERMEGRSGGHSAYGPIDVNVTLGKGLGRPLGEIWKPTAAGRWPANILLDDHAAALLDEMSGESVSSGGRSNNQFRDDNAIYGRGKDDLQLIDPGYGDSGGASRFFFTTKAQTWEREAGLDHAGRKVNDGRESPIDNPYQRGETIRRNVHPTVKPIRLIEWLARLLLPPAGDAPRRLLVPFSGSGSEMIGAQLAGWDAITGIEQSAEYIGIAEQRIAWWSRFKTYEQAEAVWKAEHREQVQRADERAQGVEQLSMFDDHVA